MTFVNPDVVPDLIAEFAKEKEQEEAEIVAQERRTRGALSNERPLTDELLDTTQVTGDDVGSVRPGDDVAP